MGNIISAVAVLLTHMLRKADAIMNPIIIDNGLTPTKEIMRKAILLCKLDFCIAMAIMKPPIKRKIIEFAYGAVATPTGAIPSTGNSIIGSREVAGMGMASLIHQKAIRTATAVVFHASGSIPAGTGNNKIRQKSTGPK
jgi:hypothetical protein